MSLKTYLKKKKKGVFPPSYNAVCTLNVFSLYGNWVTGHNTMIAGAALIVGKLAHALPCTPSFSIRLGIKYQHFNVQDREHSRGHAKNPGSRMHSWDLIEWVI